MTLVLFEVRACFVGAVTYGFKYVAPVEDRSGAVSAHHHRL